MPVLRTEYHVFRAAPQYEDVVRQTLGWHAIDALAPRTAELERVGRSRSRVWTSQPVFPGYVFACVFGPLWSRLRAVPHLHPQPLAMDGAPYRLAQSEVAAIRALQQSPPADPRAPVALHKYRQGDKVRLLQGPFASFKADVDEDKGATVAMLVQLFGRMTPYRAPRDWVEAA